MTHYNKKYFNWQKKAGEYGAEQDLWMYEPFIKKTDTTLDFGCGGGYMLEKIQCRLKYGVDINTEARRTAHTKGIKVFESLSNLPNSLKFDVVISHHTLEHLESPADILVTLKKFLKKKGTLVFVVPIDDWRTEKKYNKKDINKHFYTWTPLLIGNLLNHLEFKVESIKIIERAWLPLSRYYYTYIPQTAYKILSTIWSKLTLSRQIRIVAKAY